jgi:CBS-domain-containing membrane protein
MLKMGISAIPKGLRVKDVMSSSVVFLGTHQRLDEAWEILHTNCISGAPALSSLGRLVGIVSKADLADPRRRTSEHPSTVRDVMTRVIYAVRAGDSILAAVRLMIDEDIHRVLVVGDEGEVVGIVTPMDVLRAVACGQDLADPKQVDPPIQFVDPRELT